MTSWIGFGFFALSALIHLGFFVMEAMLYQIPQGYKTFSLSEAEHKHSKVWALNQGFYNLSLAAGMTVGLTMVLQKKILLAGVLVGFCGLTMILAGIVFAVTVPHLRKWAVVQYGPPLVGFAFLALHVLERT